MKYKLKFKKLTDPEFLVLDGLTAGTVTASKAVVVDANKKVNELNITKSLIVNLQLTNGTPVNAVAASGTLTISGVAVDSETVTIGDDIYEFAADVAQTVTGDNIAVDITSYVTASQGTLTVDTQPTAADTMTIGTKEYAFVAIGEADADGEISVGIDLATAQANIVAAINGTDGINTAHTLVSAGDFATNTCVITALFGGTDGDTIATTENFIAVTNIFNAVTLGTTTSGVDCSAANSITAIVAASVSGTENVTLADGDGDTVTVTADTAGVVGNSIATTETMANGVFSAATLENGIDGTVVADKGFWYADENYIYYAIDANTTASQNWRRIAIGSAY